MTDDLRPRLLETGRGLTVTINKRYLYSRFDPSKNAVLIAGTTPIPTETLILCVSPLLGYGLAELLSRLPASSCVLALECDEHLMALSVGAIPESILAHPSFKYIRTAAVSRVLETIHALPNGPFRRCLRLDFSGGANEHADFYALTLTSIDEYISRYWRNHLTLMKLGRSYARNLFRNCALLPDSFIAAEKSLNKPVFVAGAGPSLDMSYDFLRANRQGLFLLAVDTALPALRDAGLRPDAVVLVESQFWIERAFAGFRDSRIPVFADLTARPAAIRATGGPVFFFFSEYTSAAFIDRFLGSRFAPLTIPPLGSVGLVALYLARLMVAENIPVFFSGLDFSWGSGYTHSRGSPAVRSILNASGRLSPAGSGMPALQAGVFRINGKNNRPVNSDPSLSGYARLCAAQFGISETTEAVPPLLFDLGATGLPTGCEFLSPDKAAVWLKPGDDETAPDCEMRPSTATSESIQAFLENEKVKLSRLKNLLTGGTIDIRSGGSSAENIDVEIAALVAELDYLFLHFPDGYRGYSAEKNFLKRVRVELEYFLKTITITLDTIGV